MRERKSAAMIERKSAPAVLPVELHKWLKLEAADRGSTIGAELVAAVELLRAQRNREMTAGNKRANKAQPAAAVQP